MGQIICFGAITEFIVTCGAGLQMLVQRADDE